MYSVRIKRPNIMLFKESAAQQMIDRETMKTINRALITIGNRVRSLTPVGASGDLRSSIRSSVKMRRNDIIGRLFTGKKYAMVVEEGRKASPVSKTGQRSLKRWIMLSSKGRAYFDGLRSKYPKITLKQATFLLARSLKRKKRKGQKFFSTGVKETRVQVENMFKNLGKTIRKILGR